VLKKHVVNVCFNYFRYFRGTLQEFYINIAKVDWNVAYVAMAIHICFKCTFLIFYLYQTYVASVFI
jgi:hypothetical protein